MLAFILFLAVALPIAWLVSEFTAGRGIRVGLGIAAIALSFAVAWAVGSLDRLGSNIYFGSATKDLIQNTIVQLEKGNSERVLAELRKLRSRFDPTYETRDEYDELVSEYVNAVSDDPIVHEPGRPVWSHQVGAGESTSRADP